MFGLFDSKSEKVEKKLKKIIREMWVIGKKLSTGKDLTLTETSFIKEASNLLTKHLVEIEINLEKTGSELVKLTDEKYLDDVVYGLEEEYKKSSLQISDDHWQYINGLTMDYRLRNDLPTNGIRWRF
ncbi:hypothetical protein ABXT72_04400 [Candidatus Pelagibacter sp. Uisw_094]|jgi:hypothetical protein|uniref:hypothetical protein n=1 Tax=Candidatus Pelagibacter sp. Uisw_094 TaxID=3230980 RepID=UPI0039EBBBDF|tara:strand:+ start:214 stop:594 length:381 start_codon:yes stop_codon:yes gene_type:complete